MNRVELCNHIKSLRPENDSNIKFLSLFRSRLIEEGMPSEYASHVAGLITFDFSNVPEEDDTLSDIATEYASYCDLVYRKLKAYGMDSIRELPAFRQLYGRMHLKVDF